MTRRTAVVSAACACLCLLSIVVCTHIERIRVRSLGYSFFHELVDQKVVGQESESYFLSRWSDLHAGSFEEKLVIGLSILCCGLVGVVLFFGLKRSKGHERL